MKQEDQIINSKNLEIVDDRSDLDLTEQRQPNQVWPFGRRDDGTFKTANAMDVDRIRKSFEILAEGVTKTIFGLGDICAILNAGIPEADFKESVRKGIIKAVTDEVLRTETKSMPLSPHMRLESVTLGTIPN